MIRDLLNKSPLRYYHHHAIFAILVMVVLTPFSLDFAFGFSLCIYLSREVTQYEYEKFFDWKGLVYPLVSTIILYYAIKWI